MSQTVFTAFVSACIISGIYNFMILYTQWEKLLCWEENNVDPDIPKEKYISYIIVNSDF